MNIDGHFPGTLDFENTDVINSDLQNLRLQMVSLEGKDERDYFSRSQMSKEILTMKNWPAGAYKLLIQPNKYGGKGGLAIDDS